MSRDTFHACYYARSMKANLLDDGIGDTLVSASMTPFASPDLSGVRPMIETYPLERAAEAYARMMSGKAQFRAVLTIVRMLRSLMPALSDRYGPSLAAVYGNKAASPFRARR